MNKGKKNHNKSKILSSVNNKLSEDMVSMA